MKASSPNLPVPSWLVGKWKRSYIRRAVKSQAANTKDNDDGDIALLGEPDKTVEVTYLQTPWAFVDIRRPPVVIETSTETAMAFAGVTTVDQGDDDRTEHHNNNNDGNNTTSPPLVNWHACLEMDSKDMDNKKRWSEAYEGNPRPTEDKGYFQNVSENLGIAHAFLEHDPDNTLEELWIRENDGHGKFFAATRNDCALLVICGDSFGYANQDTNVYVSGRISKESTETGGVELLVEMSAGDRKLEGTVLNLEKDEWKILPGSTLSESFIFGDL